MKKISYKNKSVVQIIYSGYTWSQPTLCKNLLFLFIICTIHAPLFAEGTKELAPNSDDVAALYTNSTSNGSFAQYDGPIDSRLNIHIADPNNEQVFLGFSQQMNTVNGEDGNYLPDGYYFRIKDASGNIVFGPQLVNSGNANTDTWALASAGPAPIVGGSGYTPFIFDPVGLPAGDYYIEFSLSANTRAFNGDSPNESLVIKFWDITLATKDANPVAVNGRLWSKRWSLRTPSISQGNDPTYTNFDRPFNGQIYTYTEDQFVNKVDFANSGFRGLTFNLAFNDYGVQNTGDVGEDRKSVQGSNQTFAQYKTFLNNPDESVYPSGVIGDLVAFPLVVDCDPGNLCISYSSTAEGVVQLLLDFDQSSGAGLYDENSADVLLYQELVQEENEIAPYERCIPWDGLDGLGNTVDLNAVNISIHLSLVQGLVNFPVYDVEYITTGYSVSQVRPGVAAINELHYDDSNISFSPGTGINQTELNGCNSPCHNYNQQTYGDLNTINTWWYSSESASTTTQMSDCVLNAYNDSETTTENTPVDIDVTANDIGDNLDPTTVTTTGVIQPSNGTITNINPTTGVITYQPNSGFVGDDFFQYIVCDSGGGANCDTAYVYVSTNCDIISGQNIISGYLFKDVNESGFYEAGEAGDAGVTITVYEDNNQDGLVDGNDTQVTTVDTDGNGKFSVNVTPSFSGSNTYNNSSSGTLTSQGNCNNNISRTFNVTDNFIISDLNVGILIEHTWRGDLEVILTSPLGTNVSIITQKEDGSDNYNFLLDDSSTNPINNGTNDPTTPIYENHRIAEPDNPLSAFNGENANGVWTLTFCNTIFSSSSGRDLIFTSAKLDFSSLSLNQGYYVLEVDQADLPAGAIMTTDNVETAVFTETGQSDCNNYFGYVATVANASNNGPICEGQTLNLFETGGDAISWSWSGPNSFTSSNQNPSIVNVTAANSGTYTVTVTDIDGLTASTTTQVLISVPTTTASSNAPVCTGETLNLFATGDGANTFSWSGPNGFTSNMKNPTISNITTAHTGTYTVTMTNQYGCTATSDVIVSVNNSPSFVSATPNPPSCNGGSDGTIDLAITGGTAPYTYNWSNSSTTGSGNGTTISGLSPDTYDITITDNNGCTATASTVLNDSPLLSVSGTGNETTYQGASDGSINIDIQNGNPNYTVSWTGPESGSDIATSDGAFVINGLDAGDYTITITDVNGCMANTLITVIDSNCELERGPISIIKN